MPLVLDCYSPHTAIESLCEAFRCTPEQLSDVCNTTDLVAKFERGWEDIPVPFDQYLFDHLVNNLGEPKDFERICWFHGTRTTSGATFDEGILPLGFALGKIWDTMIEVAPNQAVQGRLENMKANGVNNFQFNLKVPKEDMWGPYAILVRDVAFNANKLYQHDYLGMPEIIEDICYGYSKAYDESILEVYEQALAPCLVKFETGPEEFVNGPIIAASCYVYSCLRSENITGNSVICYDGKNQIISDILSVEFL